MLALVARLLLNITAGQLSSYHQQHILLPAHLFVLLYERRGVTGDLVWLHSDPVNCVWPGEHDGPVSCLGSRPDPVGPSPRAGAGPAPAAPLSSPGTAGSVNSLNTGSLQPAPLLFLSLLAVSVAF